LKPWAGLTPPSNRFHRRLSRSAHSSGTASAACPGGFPWRDLDGESPAVLGYRIWGKILPGQWDAFEAAFKKALEIRGDVKGLKGQWLLRDENDPDAGYSISQWESADDMRAFWDSKKRSEAMAVLQPFYVNQYTITNCAVRIASSY
jgi:heme-degrading monooxygenase HmoA